MQVGRQAHYWIRAAAAGTGPAGCGQIHALGMQASSNCRRWAGTLCNLLFQGVQAQVKPRRAHSTYSRDDDTDNCNPLSSGAQLTLLQTEEASPS
jgi:hypothetical protein